MLDLYLTNFDPLSKKLCKLTEANKYVVTTVC